MRAWSIATTLVLIGCGNAPEASLECSEPGTACECPSEGAVTDCYSEPTMEGDSFTCQVGQRTCQGGQWSECSYTRTETHPASEVGAVSSALITGPDNCNVCHPNCNRVVVTPGMAEAGGANAIGLVLSPTGGLTTAPPGGGGGGATSVGPANGGPAFNLTTGDAEGLAIAPDGALELRRGTQVTSANIWISNQDEVYWDSAANNHSATITRLDISTRQPNGRFYISSKADNHPSRTSINSVGDAYIGGRTGGTITRISALGTSCPDTNGDGVITTSTNNTPLAWGQDDCVLWHRDMRDIAPNSWVRAVAAQDVTDPATGQLNEYVWVGMFEDGIIAKLNGTTGQLLFYFRILTPYGDWDSGDGIDSRYVLPYGFALDRSGNLWISDSWKSILTRVDTNQCTSSGCGPVCVDYSWYGEQGCDTAPIQLVDFPGVQVWDYFPARSTVCGTYYGSAGYRRVPCGSDRYYHSPYGITVDFQQRVWVGGSIDVFRYDRTQPRGHARFTRADMQRAKSSMCKNSWEMWYNRAGIAADALGNIWTAGCYGVTRLNANNPTQYSTRFYNGPGEPPQTNTNPVRGWGVAIDDMNRAWVISVFDPRAYVLTPSSTSISTWTTQPTGDLFSWPYTYSDMTGTQLRFGGSNRGTYYHTFEGCSATQTQWSTLDFSATIPSGTQVAFRVRTAATVAGLATAPWTAIGISPPSTSPMDVAAALTREGRPHGRYAQVELAMLTDSVGATTFVTPRVQGFTLNHGCQGGPASGSFTHVFDATAPGGCQVPPERPDWGTFHYSTSIPTGASVVFAFRMGNSVAELDAATPVRFTVPAASQTGTIDTAALFAAQGITNAGTRVRVTAELMSPNTMSMPTLYSFFQEYECNAAE